jgi:glycosyltransferase involved in cell wall biosynthesis
MSTPLRLTVLAPWGERLGGAEEGLWQALLHWDRAQIEPTVLFLGPGPFEREVAELGIATGVIPAARLRRPAATLGTVRGVASRLRRDRPDLLLDWSAKAHFYGWPAAALAGMGGRVLWWQHMIPHRHWVDRGATLLPARAIGCWSSAGQEAQDRLFPHRRSFVVNPGIEVDGEDRGAGAGSLKAELGIPAERLVVGIVGRLQPWKGQDRFLAAIADLRERGRDVHGLVVGGDAYELSPEYAAGLERLVPELGLDGFVTMTGQVPDAAPYVELMDVAVNASEEEPFGIVLIEAMAAGVPVVAVARGGPRDIVESGVSGMLAPSGEPVALADAIEALLADPQRRAAIGAAGQKRCRERFNAQLMADRLAGALTEIADR